jgi:peptidoglycan/xylan/chitin deacetylase (PgdA/CDA1 family)
MLSWGEIEEMKASGINFESHGLRHELFTMIGKDALERELNDSKRLLEARLGTTVSALAYPNGDYNEDVRMLTAKAGYHCAVSVRRDHVTASSDRYSLGRINIHDGCCRSLFGRFSRSRFACHIQRFPR